MEGRAPDADVVRLRDVDVPGPRDLLKDDASSARRYRHEERMNVDDRGSLPRWDILDLHRPVDWRAVSDDDEALVERESAIVRYVLYE